MKNKYPSPRKESGPSGEKEVIAMLRKVYDVLMFSAYGFFKTFFLLSFFCLPAFLFFNPSSVYRVKVKGVMSLGVPVGSSIGGIREKKNPERRSLKMEEAEIFRFILRFSDEIPPADAHRLARLIKRECEDYSLDPFLILAIIEVESGFNPLAVSSRGAVGLMQVMPETAGFMAEKLGISLNGDKSLFDPFINVRLGIYYFSLLINRFESIDEALIAYNSGPTKFLNGGGLERGTSYVRKVLSIKSFLEDERVITKES